MKRFISRFGCLCLLLLTLVNSAFAIWNVPTAISYVDQASGKRIIWVFSLGGNGDLTVKRWDGSQWQWSDLGSGPLGLYLTPPVTLSAITYVDGVGNQIIDVFAVASDSQGFYRLVRDHWDGTQWSWSDQGVPANLPYPSLVFDDIHATSAVTYVDAAGLRRIYVFAVAINGHLVVNYWIGAHGAQWQWSDRGLPAGVSQFSNLSAISYPDAAGNNWVYVFADTNTGNMYVHYWGSGIYSHWRNQGNTGVWAAYPSAVTYVDEWGNRRIDVFCTSGNGDLVVNYWNGSGWFWADQGRPPGESRLWWQTSATNYTDLAGKQWVYVFVLGRDTGLNVNNWDGAAWHWSQIGTPAGFSPSELMIGNSITYQNSLGFHVVDCFVLAEPNLQMAWNGLSWFWTDLGTGP
jgi:hypothetical protein